MQPRWRPFMRRGSAPVRARYPPWPRRGAQLHNPGHLVRGRKRARKRGRRLYPQAEGVRGGVAHRFALIEYAWVGAAHPGKAHPRRSLRQLRQVTARGDSSVATLNLKAPTAARSMGEQRRVLCRRGRRRDRCCRRQHCDQGRYPAMRRAGLCGVGFCRDR